MVAKVIGEHYKSISSLKVFPETGVGLCKNALVCRCPIILQVHLGLNNLFSLEVFLWLDNLKGIL